MPITDLEGGPGSRNVRRLTAAPAVDRRLSAPRLTPAASPVSQGRATPRPARSSLHQVAEALAPFSGKLSKLADEARTKEREGELAAGRLAAESGDVRSLDDIADASEAYREGAAAALGERIGFDALAELQRRAAEGVDDPNFDFEVARTEVVGEFFGADPSRSADPTLVSNGLDVFGSRSASVGLGYQEAVRAKLEGETRDVFLSNAATKARSLADLAPDERRATLASEMQALVADGRRLRLSMDDINNQRIFIAETLATETGQLDLFDVFAEPDAASGTALRDHPKWGPHVDAAMGRVASDVARKGAGASSLAQLNQRRDDAARLSTPFGMTQAEVNERVQLPDSDPRKLTVGQATAYSNSILESEAAEVEVRADLVALQKGGHVSTNDRMYTAVDRVAAGMEAQGAPPENIAQVRHMLYAKHGAIDPAYRESLKSGVLSSDPERSTGAIMAYRDMRAQHPHLAESLIDDDVRTTVRTWEGLKDAGFGDDVISSVLSKASAEFLTRRQEFLSSKQKAELVTRKVNELVDDGMAVGNAAQIKDRVRDVAATVLATGLVNTHEQAVTIAGRALMNVTQKVPGSEVRVDPSDVPFGMLDSGIMDRFADQWVRPALNNLGLDPDRDVSVVPTGRGGDVVLVDEDTGVPIRVVNFNAFSETAYRSLRSAQGTDAAKAAAAAAASVERNQLIQEGRARAEEAARAINITDVLK